MDAPYNALIGCAIIYGAVFGSLPHLSARHVWGEDLSGTLQGAGGIGGLLSSTHYPQPSPTSANNSSSTAPPLLNHGSTYYLSYDSNGNVILLTDRTGLPSAKYRYDAFGKTFSATGPMAQVNRYQFSTKPVEYGSGLAYYGYRYYSPELGRWVNRDPIGERGGMNLHGMIFNNLISQIDKLGLFLTSCTRSKSCEVTFDCEIFCFSSAIPIPWTPYSVPAYDCYTTCTFVSDNGYCTKGPWEIIAAAKDAGDGDYDVSLWDRTTSIPYRVVGFP